MGVAEADDAAGGPGAAVGVAGADGADASGGAGVTNGVTGADEADGAVDGGRAGPGVAAGLAVVAAVADGVRVEGPGAAGAVVLGIDGVPGPGTVGGRAGRGTPGGCHARGSWRAIGGATEGPAARSAAAKAATASRSASVRGAGTTASRRPAGVSTARRQVDPSTVTRTPPAPTSSPCRFNAADHSEGLSLGGSPRAASPLHAYVAVASRARRSIGCTMPQRSGGGKRGVGAPVPALHRSADLRSKRNRALVVGRSKR